MGDLQLSTDRSDLPAATSLGGDVSAVQRALRAARSLGFFLFYFVYLIFFVGLLQRLVIWPLITLRPSHRDQIVGRWLRLNGRATMALCRVLANVQMTVHGAIPAGNFVVLMNHQSVVDIAIGLALVPPTAIIPTRERYRYGLPGISPLARLARFPFVSQKARATKAEVVALARAAELVEAGAHTLLIFPEGHRTESGDIGPFMTSGLELILARARRPVYCIVGDGMHRTRTFHDATRRFADSDIRIQILGPFDPPAEKGKIAPFLASLREHMVDTLGKLRAA